MQLYFSGFNPAATIMMHLILNTGEKREIAVINVNNIRKISFNFQAIIQYCYTNLNSEEILKQPSSILSALGFCKGIRNLGVSN